MKGATMDENGPPGAATELWHVTVTVSGPSVPMPQLRVALDRLTQERPFMVSVRYAADRVELRYWDEGESLDDVAALALRVWGDHRRSAGLPDWSTVGVEVIDRDSMHRRGDDRPPSLLVEAGVTPL